MFFSTNKFVIDSKNSKKLNYSSTLQSKKATDFCDNMKYSSVPASIPNFKQFSIIFQLKNNAINLKRTSLSTRFSGIITVEASIILPIFILAIASIIYLFNVLHIQNTFQERLSSIAKDISQTAYTTSSFSKLNIIQQNNLISMDDSIIRDITTSAISGAYVKNKFLDNEITEFINSNYIKNGTNGLSFMSTSYDSETKSLDIVLTYQVSIPFLPDLISLPIQQHCKIRLFSGLNITEAEALNELFVYICIEGNVYHTNKYCSYLLKYTQVLEMKDLRFYSLNRCSICDTMYYNPNTDYSRQIIYVTEFGNFYHMTLDCPVFVRNIHTIKFSDLPDYYELCERCEAGIQ